MKPSSSPTILWGACLAAFALPAAADWRYRSRPELAVPTLNITTRADPASLEKGLLFVAPYQGWAEGHAGPVQPGAYIYRDDGELVWSGTGYHAGLVANFRPDVWQGKPVLRAFEGGLSDYHGRMFGYHSLLGSDYKVAKVVHTGLHRLVSAHEFHIVDGETALMDTPIPRIRSLREWGGDEDQVWILSNGFQGTLLPHLLSLSLGTHADQMGDAEQNIETGEVVFEWESLDHVNPKRKWSP